MRRSIALLMALFAVPLLAAPFSDIVSLPNPSTSGNVLTSNGTNWVSAAASGAPTGAAGGDLGGTYPNPSVAKITTTSGPTSLTIGAITDGQYLVRSGSTIVSSAISSAGSPFGYETFTTNTVLTSSSKKFQACDTQYSTTTPVSITVTMPDCAAGTQGFEYVITHPMNTEAGACVVLPGSGDTIDIHAFWVMSAAGESVTLVCNSGTNMWVIAAENSFFTSTSWNWKTAFSTATTMVTIGQVVPTVTGGASAGMMVGNLGPRVNLGTAASTNDFVQFATSTADAAEFLLSPAATAVFGLGGTAADTNYRIWPIAISASTPQASNTLAVVGAGIVAATTGDAQWQCCTYDGATASCVDIGTLARPATTNTTAYRATLHTAFGLGVGCTVQILSNADSLAGSYGSVWKTTNIDATGTTDLGVFSTLTTLANEGKNHQLANMRVRVSR